MKPDGEDLADAVEDELERGDVGNSVENRNRFKREEPVVQVSGSEPYVEEANEPIAKQEVEARSGHDARERAITVVPKVTKPNRTISTLANPAMDAIKQMPRSVQASASSQASGQVIETSRPMSAQDMVGQVRGLRRAPPFNPVVASQSQRANYFSRGHLSSAPRMGHPLTMTHARPNYYAGPKLKSVGTPLKFGFAGKQKLNTRWKRAW